MPPNTLVQLVITKVNQIWEFKYLGSNYTENGHLDGGEETSFQK